MRTHFKAFMVLGTLLLLVSLACSLSDVPERVLSSPTPIPPPTPPGDTFTINIPAYTVRLAPGDKVPRTGLEYLRTEEGKHIVLIDGQESVKRSGDSFIWSGVVAPGVFGNYNLRLTGALLGRLPVAGSVELIIFNPEPIFTELATNPETHLHFQNIIIDYTVPVNLTIPGTTFKYAGIEQVSNQGQGIQMAKINGISGNANRAQGDSLIWSGRLRDNVILNLDLRVISFNEQQLRLGGRAELWITS